MISNAVRAAGLAFEPLFTATPHVFVSRDSPLARRASVTLADLRPYPRLSYDQGIHNSPYFAEELHITEPAEKSIVVTDRATLFNLLIGLGGYTISSGILSEALNGSQIVAVPLESDERMELGYVRRHDRPPSPIARAAARLRRGIPTGRPQLAPDGAMVALQMRATPSRRGANVEHYFYTFLPTGKTWPKRQPLI